MKRLREATLQGTEKDITYAPRHKAEFAVKTFEYGCFFYYFEPEKTAIWADTFFDKVDDERKDVWRALAGTGSGRAWHAPFPQGALAVIHDPDKGGCHVISWEADAALLHEEIRSMGLRAKGNLLHAKVNYFYRLGTDEAGRNHSLITILIPDEDTHVMIDVATYADNHAPAVMSITSNRNFADNFIPTEE